MFFGFFNFYSGEVFVNTRGKKTCMVFFFFCVQMLVWSSQIWRWMFLMNWAVSLLFLLGSPQFDVPPWVPTACPGSQPQMATGVFFRVCGLDWTVLQPDVFWVLNTSCTWALICLRSCMAKNVMLRAIQNKGSGFS